MLRNNWVAIYDQMSGMGCWKCRSCLAANLYRELMKVLLRAIISIKSVNEHIKMGSFYNKLSLSISNGRRHALADGTCVWYIDLVSI